MNTEYLRIQHEIRSTLAGMKGNRALSGAVQLLKARFPKYTWVGIYLLEGDELVLGPFLGKPSPHTRIPLGRGICGAAATSKSTIVVDEVNSDPRYLACSVETQSEIVVPMMHGTQVVGEIDVDSDTRAAFTKDDRELLESVARMLVELMDLPEPPINLAI